MEQIDDPRGELAPGSTFAQAYRVVRVIAEGGMGTVYEVTQANTGQRRALKVLHLWLADDERVRQRFVLEARVSASIESDHVVQVVDAGIAAPGNVPWYVMEYLEGETLAEHGKRRGPLPPLEVLEIFEQLGHGVGAAHQRKVVHCDLKPDNLHIAASRRADAKRTVKVLDFGIANVIPELKTYAQLTRGRGTPGWLAPEQFAAQGQVSAATDVWALGLIAFWLLTGGSYWKFYGKYPAVLMEIEGARLESATARAASLGLRGVPPKGFDEWFSRCLDRDPAQRFRDATEAVDALRAVLAPTESPRMSAPAGGTVKLDESLLRARGLLLNLGEVERQGDVEARVRIGEEVLALGNREAEVESRTAAAHVARAWAREQRGDRKGALADAERAVSLSPDAPQGHYLLGVLRSRSLSWSQAAVSLSRAVALNPEAVAFVRERARVHLLQGQLDRALSDASRAIELDASRADAWVTRAMVHIARRDLASADRDLTEALGREPGSIDARRARASLRAERGDHAGALADLDDLATRAPGDGAHWFERCRVLRAVGDPVTALEALRRAAACGHVLAAEELRALGLG